MNLLADESVDGPIVERLRQDGRDVLYVAEMEPSIPDEVVLQRANEHHAILVTEDKDFGELVYRQGLVPLGVILIRLAGLSPQIKACFASKVIAERAAEMPDAFCVISPGTVRIRPKLKLVSQEPA
jgi:predicted nuclease of predicted toxin-antitoxin system